MPLMDGPVRDASVRRAGGWRGLRDRLLSSPGFRRWAAAFPLTRPVARRRTRALFDLCGGFVYSQILFACVELGLFDILAEGPQTTAVLGPRLSLSPDATERLLAAAISLKLVDRRSDDRLGPERFGHEVFGLGPLGAAMVGNPGIAAMVRHHAVLYRDLANPVALLRGEQVETGLSRYWAYARAKDPAGLGTGDVGDYTALMAASQSLVAAEILDAYPIGRHRCVLDVGGGAGAFLAAAAMRAPALQLMLFDLPPVAERAKAVFAAEGLAHRATVTGGDFRTGALPTGADLVSLVRVLHDHDDDAALALLRAVRLVLPADGALLIAEPMAGTQGAEPVGDAYFGFYLLAMRSGRPRTPAAIGELLRAAGFGRWRLVPNNTPLLVRLIVARP